MSAPHMSHLTYFFSQSDRCLVGTLAVGRDCGIFSLQVLERRNSSFSMGVIGGSWN